MYENGVDFNAFRAVLVGKALMIHVIEKIYNIMIVFTVSSFDVTKEIDNRVYWKDLLAVLAVCLPFLTFGIATTLLSLSTVGETIWNQTGLIIGAAVSGPVMCYVIDKCGRKIGIFIVYLVQGTTCIPLFLIPSTASVLTLHILTGISSGGLFTVLPIYLLETFPTKIRASALALTTVMVSTGLLMKLAMSEEALMLAMVALVMIEIMTLSIMVESPSYLVIVDKIEAAESAVAKLKYTTKDGPAVKHEVNMLKQESERARANGKITLYSFFKNRIWLDITKIGIMLFTIKELCGSIIFLDQDKTLLQLGLPSDPDRMLVVTAWCAGCIFCLVFVSFVERRYLLTFGYVVMVLSMGVLGVYTQADLTVKTLRWLPVAVLPILVFGYGVTWGMPTIIMVEMYNLEIRATLIGVLYAYSEIVKLAHVHTFKYIEDYMGTYTVFYIFACVNLFAGVYALFAIPDIKNKSVRQIERQLKRIPILK
ncbi:probable metabolite transport protein CsbC [Amyelois transitella]|uniref:probable metabolite transport protein CsbC n=1 Tax=Amyelois transitella TaxID=680683 RepID=UPI00067D82B0|nr:probable metabolite transport protein CsbC [Amyelois transitella]